MENELPPQPDSEPQAMLEPAPVLEPPFVAASVAPAVASVALPAPGYRDRGTGLVIFGVVQIILGLLAALMVPFVVLGAFMARLAPGGAMRYGHYFSAIVTYTLVAAAMLTLGVGSVQKKRWARALTLVTSWYWLIVGVLATILLTAVLPVAMRGALEQAQRNSPDTPSVDFSTGVMAVVITLMIVLIAFFLVVVPIGFIVFYGRKDVAETCRHRDPVERWTDRTPLPVLGASVIFFTGALYLLLVGVTTPLFPFFGRYLSGVPGAACFVVMASLDLYLAVALFRLQNAGWWIAILAVPFRVVSMAITYARADLMQAYSRMGMSDAQIQVLGSSPVFRGSAILWWSLIWMVLFFGYLVWLKRYFKTPEATPMEALPAQAG